MKTSIIILTYNKLNYTQMCIDSIRKYTDKGTYEIIIVDNNSSDGTVEWLKEQKDIRTIFNNENLGFPKGCNQGIEVSEGENILLLNNDTIVTKNWLNNMIKCLYSNSNVGAVGCVTNDCSNYQTIECNYQTIEEMFDFSAKHNISNEKLWEERLKLIGFCMLIKKEVVSKIGLLDEIFTPGNFEDDDYSFRIIKSGYKLFLCKDTFIHHFGSTSFKEKPHVYFENLKINQKKFLHKWGFDSNYSSNIRYDVIGQIKEALDKPINVLEIGCGCGATLLKIKDIYKKSNVYALELNQYSAEIAKHVADVVCANIENAQLSFETGFFNYIILADVLEHLTDPWTVLVKLKKYLKKDGYIISSIPNVMHISIIKDLLYGNWSYQESGILDRTHLRFFTLNEIQKLFHNCGYLNIETSSIIIPTSNEDKEFINKLSEISGRDVKDNFNAYQYIVKAGLEKMDKIDKFEDGQFDEATIRKLKFILRRIENDIETDLNVNKLLEMLFEKKVTSIKIIDVISRDIIKKNKLLNNIAVSCFNEGLFDNVIPFLQASFELDNKDKDTIYNLGVVLNKFGEKELALKYLYKLEENDEEIKSMIKEIERT